MNYNMSKEYINVPDTIHRVAGSLDKVGIVLLVEYLLKFKEQMSDDEAVGFLFTKGETFYFMQHRKEMEDEQFDSGFLMEITPE